MATLETRKVEAAITGKLAMERDSKRKDHIQYVFRHDGRVIGRTHFSHTPKMKTLGPDLIKKMAGQMKVDVATFTGVVVCTHSREDYINVAIRNQQS